MTKHILVVEDERHLADGIQYNLQAEGYRVTVVEDGPLALKVMQNPEPAVDLVILDLMLPGMSGYAVCESLRDAGHQIPILILSARTLSEDRTRGFNVGADQYLSKPFDLEELLSRVKNLLSRKRSHTPAGGINGPLVKFGNVQVNFDTFEVRVGDRPVRLTQLEMRLLEYFIRNEGRVIPRQELLEQVWDIPGHVNTRAPDQFIRRLRKALEPDASNPQHILTIRDAGYRFIANP